MTAPEHAVAASVARAEADLAKLQAQVQALRAVLAQLMQDVVLAESRLARTESARLVEVNEHLVVAALASRADADTAALALEQARMAAAQDTLTGLPNRSALSAEFTQALARARRHSRRLALLFLDLDGFKQLNDERGHAFGDKVLCLVAERMRSAVREVDTVSRHGGDEFLVLLGELAEPDDALAVARKLIAAVSAAARVDGMAVRITASIGIALYPDDGDDERSLVRQADARMYAAKRRGAGGIAFQNAFHDPARR